ncbi:hypothetical protein BS17DRAFT_839504 [Gyrodon lividus]|nr:hypothetical protein BS17DRAFT_839504 [Gyrodon lividus]
MIQSMYQDLLVEMQSVSNRTATWPTPSTHPKVCWWKQSQFDKFVLSPEDAVAKLGSVPYLETEDGEPISNKSLKAIRQTLRGAWTELANQGKAPQMWGILCISGSELFTSLMEAAHPIFKLVEDSWKLTTQHTHTLPGKKAIKEEDDESSVVISENLKCKGSNSHPKALGKHFKGEKQHSAALSVPPHPIVANSELEGHHVESGPTANTLQHDGNMDKSLDLHHQMNL